MANATLILTKDKAVVCAHLTGGDGYWEEKIVVRAYDSMAQSRALELVNKLGWVIVETIEAERLNRAKMITTERGQDGA